MALFEGMSALPAGFSGHVRLFPLPNLVMFPHVLQPLHVFEPRYREMVEDALNGDRLIAMALLKPGWEMDYESRPAIYSAVCLGRVATYHRLADGRFNLLLEGLCRARVVDELAPKRLFREAQVEVCVDEYPVEGAATRPALERELVERFQANLPQAPEAQEQLTQLLSSKLPLGVLTDVAAYSLELPLIDKQRLLDETNVDRRAGILIAHLQAAAIAASEATFPPEFSIN